MKTHRWTLTLILVAGAWRASGQTAVDLSRQGKVGTGTILPARCTVGQIFFKTDAPAGTNLFACTTPNAWATVGLPTLAGDASGTQQSLTVQAIQGHGVSAAAPTDQNVLRWNAATGLWEPAVVPATGPAAPPATCAAGSFYLQSDSADNIQQLYVCANTNTWAMASARSGPAANRPLNCVTGQTWLSTDTGALTYCSVTGSPGTWNIALAGPQGPSGPQGPAGIAGAIGPTGANGNTILSGAVAPSAGLGVNGDFYLSTAGNCLYGPKASGAWPVSCASLVGPQGPQGLGGSPPTWSAVAFSSTPTFVLSAPVQAFQLTLTGNVTSSAFSGTLQSGQLIVFKVCQNSAGGHTFAPPASVMGFGSLDTTGSVCNTQAFQYDGTNLAAITPMRSDNPIPQVSAVNGLYSLPASPTALIGTTDSRLSDARTPTAHAAAHTAAGSDPLTLGVAQVAGAEASSNKSANPSLGTSDTLYPTQQAVKTYVDSNTIKPASPTITGTAAMQQVSSSVVNPTTGNDPNNRRAWDLYIATDSSNNNPNYSDQNGFALTFNAMHGDNSYGSGTNAKTTFLPFAQAFNGYGAGQRIMNGMTMNAYGMGDSALHSESITYANGPTAGDEVDGGFTSVSYSQQQTSLARATITSVPAQTTCNTTITQAITASKDVQTVTIASTTNCHVGDWVVLGQAFNNGYMNLGLTQITAVAAGSISGIFRNNQISGATVTPALVLNLDSTYQFGQQRVLVNTGTSATYSTGAVSGVSGGGFIGSGTSWTAAMVGGSLSAPYANVGVIALTSDDYSGPPFNGVNEPLKSWYEIIAVPSSTSIGIHSFSVAGDAAYHGKGAPSSYIIRPGARILKINGSQVILETTTTTWTAGDTVECAISPYPDVTGFQYQLSAWTPGGNYRGFLSVRNNGARQFGSVFSVGDSAPSTGSNSDTYKWGSILSSLDKTSGPSISLGGSGSGQALYIPTTGSTDTGKIFWRQSGGLEFTLGRREDLGAAGMLEIGQGASGTNYMDFFPAGGNHTWTWPAKSGTVAMLSDLGNGPGQLFRSLPPNQNDAVDIGAFNASADAASNTYTISIAGQPNAMLARYYELAVPIETNAPTTWYNVLPVKGKLYSGDFVDFALEVNVSSSMLTNFRIRRVDAIGGGQALTVTIQRQGSAAVVFSPSTAVTSVAPPTANWQDQGVWPGSFEMSKSPAITASIDPSSLSANRTFTLPDMGGTVGLVLTGTTGSIGGGALTAGACTSGTVNVTGATTGMAVAVSPSGGIDPTNNNALGATWEGYVSSANTVTVKVCAPVAGTPAAAMYNVRVIQ